MARPLIEAAEIRSRLDLERTTALGAVATMEADIDELVASVADSNLDDEHDPEGATIAFERAQLSTRLEEARSTLIAVSQALQRLDEGRYGTCERCGEPIAEERLLALPTVRTCYSCASSR
jgi:RNA polymerase-binding transcription factor DksA